MSDKRFTIHKESKYKEEWYAYPFCIKEDGEVVFNTIPLSIAEKVRDKLNEQQDIINKQLDQIIELQDKYGILEFNHSRLEKRNKAQYEKIGEQQAEIEQLKEGDSDELFH